MNIDGSVREHTKTHTHVRLKHIELALFTLCDGSFVFWADISAQVMVRRPITRSICRIGPVVGIGLPVGSTLVVGPTYEPQHYKTNKMTCAPGEDSDQPGHPPSLISLRSAQTGYLRTQYFFMRTAETLIRLGGCPGGSESSLGAEVILLVWSYRRRLI